MIIQDIILIAAILGVMVLGLFIAKRLDKLLNENRKRTEQEKNEKEPSCVMLTTELSDEEIVEKIRSYEKKYGEANITLYIDKDDLYDELFDGKR